VAAKSWQQSGRRETKAKFGLLRKERQVCRTSLAGERANDRGKKEAGKRGGRDERGKKGGRI
jgi:hypothetical protein